MENKTGIKTETIFLFLSLIFGLMFAISVHGVHDESTHLNKAFDVSEGHIFPENANVTTPENLETYTMWQTIDQPVNKNGNRIVDMSGQSIMSYSPLPYLSSSLVIKVGVFFNCSAIIIVIMCRIINLLIYTFIVYFALKIIPILKTALLLIALMPSTISHGASASGDSLTIALSFLVIAIFLNLALSKNKIQRKDVFIIFISSLALSLTKPTYALLSLLFFIIPHSKFKNLRNGIITFICSCLIPLSISVIWNAKFKHLYSDLDYSFNSYMNVHTYNITFLSSHPLKFLDMITNTIIYNNGFTINTLIPQFVADHGSGFGLPLFLTYIYLIVLLVVSLYNVSGLKINLKQKLIGLSVFSIIFSSISIAEFITWTPLGEDIIWGLQGRYFIPLAPLLLLVFNNSLKNNSLKKFYKKFNWNIVVILYIVFFLSLSLFFIATNQKF
ncbi:MAG: DUF2142 domain-containing protein [Methanobrevibacter sp.]|jgi:uncharacterized membrane protein|nr:DUF2142 domain-containing protein [Candidatus Methanovirga meridionalis]